MIKEHYRCVLLGSGWFSAGYAASHEGTLIIEQQGLADPHFAPRMIGDGCDAPGDVSDDFAELVEDGKTVLANSEPILSRYFLKNGNNILFYCLA